ncbi:MAG: hypothetical protein R3C44_20725 [Chloroflexota bacterium]
MGIDHCDRLTGGILLAACAQTADPAPPTASAISAVPPTVQSPATATVPAPTPDPTAETAAPTETAVPTTTTVPTATDTPVPTPDPYADLTIDALAERSYGGGLLEIVDTLETTDTFTRYEIKYPSDGLDIYGFMNVPIEGDNFPVALVLHGYIDPADYDIVDYNPPLRRCPGRGGLLRHQSQLPQLPAVRQRPGPLSYRLRD